MANEYYLQHVAFIIGQGEGSVRVNGSQYYIVYDLVELGEPYEGIGLLQWSFGRSFDILRDIYVALGNNFGGTTPPSDIQSAISGNNRWTTYKWIQASPATKWVREFLTLDVAKTVALEKYLEEIQGYIDQMNGQGVTDLRSAGYCSDVTNQYGGGWGRVWGGARYNSSHNTLDSAHKATPQTYRTRRNNVYNYLKNANFDVPPPIDYDAVIGDSQGGEADSPPLTDDSETVVRAIAKKVQDYQKISNTYVWKSGDSYYNKYFKITPTTGYRQNFTTMLVKTLVDLYELVESIEYEYIVEAANEREKESEDSLDEKAKNDHDNISDFPEAIQKAVAKALSYPDNSVQYSMSGARDMKSSGDCSCFTEICFRSAGQEIGGYTGAQYQTALKRGWVVVDGGRNVISQIVSQARAGDYVLMSQTTNYQGNGPSHVGIMVSSDGFRHQSASGGINGKNGKGPVTDNLSQYLNNYLGSSYIKFTLCRPLQ